MTKKEMINLIKRVLEKHFRYDVESLEHTHNLKTLNQWENVLKTTTNKTIQDLYNENIVVMNYQNGKLVYKFDR